MQFKCQFFFLEQVTLKLWVSICVSQSERIRQAAFPPKSWPFSPHVPQSPVAQIVKNPPTNAGNLGLISESGRSPEKENGNPLQYSCWEIPWTEELGGLPSTGSQRRRHDSASKQQQQGQRADGKMRRCQDPLSSSFCSAASSHCSFGRSSLSVHIVRKRRGCAG